MISIGKLIYYENAKLHLWGAVSSDEAIFWYSTTLGSPIFGNSKKWYASLENPNEDLKEFADKLRRAKFITDGYKRISETRRIIAENN